MIVCICVGGGGQGHGVELAGVHSHGDWLVSVPANHARYVAGCLCLVVCESCSRVCVWLVIFMCCFCVCVLFMCVAGCLLCIVCVRVCCLCVCVCVLFL